MSIRPIALLLACAAPLAAQGTDDFRWEKALPAGSSVRLHNLSGNVTVSPSTSGKVEIVGVKRGSRRYFADVSLEVVETPSGIIVCPVLRTADTECGEEGFRVHDNRRRRDRDDDWNDVSIDIVAKVPKAAEIHAGSVSGDVTITGAEGRVRGSSVSGEVEMRELRASSVRASSVSGDVRVSIIALTGDGPLTFHSVSGDVTAELPRNTEADVTMRSVSGSLDSEFPLTLNGRMNRHSLEARIGKGGRELEVHTVSGNVRLLTAK